jgi:hypothetical protein
MLGSCEARQQREAGMNPRRDARLTLDGRRLLIRDRAPDCALLAAHSPHNGPKMRGYSQAKRAPLERRKARVCRHFAPIIAGRRLDRTSSTSWGSQVRALYRPRGGGLFRDCDTLPSGACLS